MLVHRNYLAGMMNSNLRIFIRTVFYQQLTDYFFIANQNSFAAILFNSVDLRLKQAPWTIIGTHNIYGDFHTSCSPSCLVLLSKETIINLARKTSSLLFFTGNKNIIFIHAAVRNHCTGYKHSSCIDRQLILDITYSSQCIFRIYNCQSQSIGHGEHIITACDSGTLKHISGVIFSVEMPILFSSRSSSSPTISFLSMARSLV